MAENYGYQPQGEYEVPVQAALARLRSNQARQRGQLAQAVASRGVRTSGVSTIPGEALDRGFADAEAGIIGDFAQQQVTDSITDRRLSEARQFEREQLERSAELERAANRRGFMQDIIGRAVSGGIGLIGRKKYYADSEG